MMEKDQKILILFAHPALHRSRVNSKLIEGIEEIQGVYFHDLYKAYPDMHIDIDFEQQLLEQHDVIIFHHPVFWYSTPAILKEWQDLVLTHGWAYGSQGNALKGKLFLNVTTTGGPERAYLPGGHNRFTIRQLLAPIEQTAWLCKMTFLAPFAVHGTHSITPEETEEKRLEYHDLLRALKEGSIDIEKASKAGRINDPGEKIIPRLNTSEHAS